MVSVLLVNDKTDVLDRLKKELQLFPQQWEIRTVNSIARASAELGQKPAHVVVTSLQLGGTGGVEFLEHLRNHHPAAVRFALSGEIQRGDADRANSVAHQVFPVAGNTMVLCQAIERVASLLDKIEMPAVKRAVEAVHALPPLPPIYFKLREELEKSGSTSATVARIIEHDPAMSARLLQMANSPYFGFGRPALSVREAATRLGLQHIQSVVLLLAMTATKPAARLPRGFSLAAMQDRAERVASLATAMLSVPDDRRVAFSAGMLHHIGYFVLALRMPEDYEKVMAAAAGSDRPIDQIESELWGCNHAEVGAFMLTLLGLPPPLVEAVANHHRPSASKEWFGPAAAVHIACLLAAQAEGQTVSEQAWDHSFLDSLPPVVRSLIERWRAGEPVRERL